MTTNRQWRFISYPTGLLSGSNLEWREEEVLALKEGEFLVRNIYVSVDPGVRLLVNGVAAHMPPVQLGDVMLSLNIARVEESRHAQYKKGDMLYGAFGWQDYMVTDGSAVLWPAVQQEGLPLHAHLGLFAHIGPASYIGVVKVGEAKPGETLVVSAAAGAVGSLAGQIGKIKGCRVVGITGSNEKCRWLVDELGFDAAINYKTQPIAEALRQHCPNGIDIYFDNVGGDITSAVVGQINHRARIALCGLLADYNNAETGSETPYSKIHGPYNYPNILFKRAKIEAFVMFDDAVLINESIAQLTEWYLKGQLKYQVDIVQGLEHTPEVANRLFEGRNIGKLLVQVSPE